MKTASLTWIEAMLRDVVAVVGRVNYICVIEDARGIQPSHEPFDDLIDSLESL